MELRSRFKEKNKIKILYSLSNCHCNDKVIREKDTQSHNSTLLANQSKIGTKFHGEPS